MNCRAVNHMRIYPTHTLDVATLRTLEADCRAWLAAHGDELAVIPAVEAKAWLDDEAMVQSALYIITTELKRRKVKAS